VSPRTILRVWSAARSRPARRSRPSRPCERTNVCGVHYVLQVRGEGGGGWQRAHHARERRAWCVGGARLRQHQPTRIANKVVQGYTVGSQSEAAAATGVRGEKSNGGICRSGCDAGVCKCGETTRRTCGGVSIKCAVVERGGELMRLGWWILWRRFARVRPGSRLACAVEGICGKARQGVVLSQLGGGEN